MTQVEFFVFNNPDWAFFVQSTCALLNRARWQRQTLYIHSDQQAWQQRLVLEMEQQLQTPIARVDQLAGTGQHPLAFGATTTPRCDDYDLVLNLSASIPAFFSHFPQHWELVAADEKSLTQGREKYSFYRDRGYPLRHHTL